VQLQNSIRGTLKPLGINMKSAPGKGFISAVHSFIPVLPAVIGNAIVTVLECLASVMKSIEELDEQLTKQTMLHPQVLKLMTVDGIGPVTALAFFAEVGDPHRFKNLKAIGAYLGLTPKQYSSGEKEVYGRISKRGNAMLRGLLAQCALVMLTRTKKWSKLRAWGAKIQSKRGHQKAIVALSRKLAVIMLKMLLDDTTFKRGEKKQAA
ncbi:MAG: IS110 family transposase, partial [Chlamydiia bacterium]|nr:IS110 family transposase [Chlamydiia bacterium]